MLPRSTTSERAGMWKRSTAGVVVWTIPRLGAGRSFESLPDQPYCPAPNVATCKIPVKWRDLRLPSKVTLTSRATVSLFTSNTAHVPSGRFTAYAVTMGLLSPSDVVAGAIACGRSPAINQSLVSN